MMNVTIGQHPGLRSTPVNRWRSTAERVQGPVRRKRAARRRRAWPVWDHPTPDVDAPPAPTWNGPATFADASRTFRFATCGPVFRPEPSLCGGEAPSFHSRFLPVSTQRGVRPIPRSALEVPERPSRCAVTPSACRWVSGRKMASSLFGVGASRATGWHWVESDDRVAGRSRRVLEPLAKGRCRPAGGATSPQSPRSWFFFHRKVWAWALPAVQRYDGGRAVGGAPMNENELFQAALGLLPPWLGSRCTFSESAGRLDIHLDFPRGGVFPCPVCGVFCKAYDTDELTWRHLNFSQHQAFLHARTLPASSVRAAAPTAWRFPGPDRTVASPCCLRRWS